MLYTYLVQCAVELFVLVCLDAGIVDCSLGSVDGVTECEVGPVHFPVGGVVFSYRIVYLALVADSRTMLLNRRR